MDFDRYIVRRRTMLNEDRLSGLPDELLHQILSCVDTKIVVQTCLLSPRWKILWRSMPCLTLSSQEFDSLRNFSKFVTKFLSRRNHQINVSSIKLSFHGPASQVFVKKIARYAFSHNIQELIVISNPKNYHGLPLCLFSSVSLSLTHLNFSSTRFYAYFPTPKMPWHFPVLTTLNLNNVTLRSRDNSIDLFSKCFNLKNLTLKSFSVSYVTVFDIITPRLENLSLINCAFPNIVNVIAPQLVNLTVIDCSIKYLNAPPGISSFCYENDNPLLQLPTYCFHSLNIVSVTLNLRRLNIPYKEQDARNTINMLQKLHSARFLTLNLDIVECLSLYPKILLHQSSPFSNLVSLIIDSKRKEAYKVKLSIVMRDFLLRNSPNAILITDLPEDPKETLEKEAAAKKEAVAKKAKLTAEIKRHMLELQASVEQENMLLIQRKNAKEEIKAFVTKLMPMLPKALALLTQTDSNKIVKTEVGLAQLTVKIQTCARRLHDLYLQEYKNYEAIRSKETQIISLLKNLPTTQDRTEYFCQLKVTETLHHRLLSTLQDLTSFNKKIIDLFREHVSYDISTFQDIARVAEDWAKRSSLNEKRREL